MSTNLLIFFILLFSSIRYARVYTVIQWCICDIVSPRLILLDSLSAFLYDISDPISSSYSTFQKAMKALTRLLREKKSSLIVISPGWVLRVLLLIETLRNSSMFYFPSNAWCINFDHRLHCQKIRSAEPEDPSCSKFSITEVGNRDKRSVFSVSTVDWSFSGE